MAAESVAQLLRTLTATAGGESAEQTYAKWAGLTLGPDDSLDRLVARKLTANAKAGQIRSSLLETLKAGGAVGESVEECLRNTDLVAWS